MNEEIMVSIFCLVFNHELFLKETLDGFVKQKTNFSFEVLIHDDASTDNSALIIKEYTKKYPDLFVPIYQKENQYSKGIPIEENYLFPKARGKYIAECEGDDCWIFDNKLQMQIDYLEAHPNVSGCVGGAKVVDYSNKKKVYNLYPTRTDRLITMEEAILHGMVFPTSTFVYRKSVFKSDLFSCLNLNFSDYTTILQIILNDSLYSFHHIFSKYRLKTPGSWTEKNTTSIEGLKKNLEDLTCLYEYFNLITKNQYKEYTEKAILDRNFEILLLQKRYDKLKQEPYKDEYRNYRSIKNSISRFLLKNFPALYNMYGFLKCNIVKMMVKK